ncbi:hypothetical protein GIB67_004374 [Kingdonia uniflora]|uniref:Wall-associated receptor kinase galacturonan-binding domain-containing protein n=1 Tax=Kingdonia uniflora TaxID=39325 RepID=A0A7J7MRC8_9MAGN|nr:hypothetical protein GIB67_004374 [Kingdonia uniflora]
MNLLLPIIIVLLVINERASARGHSTCRSFCGNLTVDYPFTVQSGCGHPGFRDLLFCINDVLMFHISSGSYRVLEIDYAYQALTLHDPDMSTCNKIVRGRKGNGFVIDLWRSSYFKPVPDNVFMLIGCSTQSPLYQGFPGQHLPCRNVSGMGCEEYYDCPAWDLGRTSMSEVYGASPPECCSVTYNAIHAINLSRLECEGYSSAYSLAPLHLSSPKDWSYGIRVTYSVPGDWAFCRSCEATGGTCGYDDVGARDLCLCNGWNSTTNCDSGRHT